MFKNVTINQEKFEEIIEKHFLWERNYPDGERMILDSCSLEDIDFTNLFQVITGSVILCCEFHDCKINSSHFVDNSFLKCYFHNCSFADVDFEHCSLQGTMFVSTTFTNCNFKHSYLCLSDIQLCDFNNCSFSNCDFCMASIILSSSISTYKFQDCSFDRATINKSDIPVPSIVPECGSFIGWKKCFIGGPYEKTPVIVKLEILEDSKRSNGTRRKCRCEKAKVLSITSIDGETSYDFAYSIFNPKVVYRVGDTVKSDSFDDDRFNSCSNGIHFFITRQEAVDYNFT